MAHVGFYFTNHKNKTVELPIAPAEFMVGVEFDNEPETILKTGEVNRIGERKLYQMPIEGILPVNTNHSHLVTAKRPLGTAIEYINFFRDWQDSKKPGRIVISGGKINLPATIEKFNYGKVDGNDSEFKFTLEVKEWRQFAARKLNVKAKAKKKVAKKAPKRPKPPRKIGVGSVVTVNGRLHRDSYGAGPGQTERNAKRKINFVNKGAKFPYHVTNMQGGWRGWVSKKAVK